MHQPAIPPASAPTPHADSAFPRLYVPEEVAAVLGCSAWWVKDRARRRLIPFTRVGRAYRFTGEHLAEIIRMHEARPAALQQHRAAARASKPPTPQPSPPSAAPAARLRARPPRRARQGQFGTAA
ncbi:helix-turn-helix domain-containing protein [Streptomyces silvensis]|uniref:helix-turn-helix domain-containing protein n=1 Tax=Streptomyces silvensis TaxID=1765722 RepID=UPI00099F18B0